MNVRPTQPGSAVRPYTPPATKAMILERAEAATSPAPDTAVPAATRAEQPERVLRLLQDGHGRGVAAARLHLNLYEEQTAAHRGSIRANVQQRITGLSGRFAELADELLPVELHRNDIGERFADILSAFDAAALAALTAYDPADAAESHVLQRTLQSTFDALRGSALDLFGHELSAVEPPPQTGVPGAPSDEEAPAYPPEIPSPLAQFMTELASTFSEAMRELSTYVTSAKASPPLSEIRGEGAAYDKLIAGYNSSRSQPGLPHTEQLNVRA